MELFYPCDRAMSSDLNPNLPIADIQDLNEQMNCNLEFSDESENYFNNESLPEHISIVDEMEMFCRDAECEAFN